MKHHKKKKFIEKNKLNCQSKANYHPNNIIVLTEKRFYLKKMIKY